MLGERELVCRPFFRARIGVKSGAAAAANFCLKLSRNLERHKEKLISRVFDDAIDNLQGGLAECESTFYQFQFPVAKSWGEAP